MIALSTSWKSTDCDNGEALIRAIEQFPISEVELEYRITEPMYQQMRRFLKNSAPRVISIHNFSPVPPIVPRSMASGDLFLLSHTDREERLQAVQWTVRTIECANDLEARAVVLHGGRIDMNPEMEVLKKHLDEGTIDSEEAQDFIREKMAERERKKSKHIDALFFSLEKLIAAAERYHIQLGLENRYGYHELPGPDEFGEIFEKFDGAPLYYWHDVGHAQVNENLGLVNVRTLLETLSEKLIGMHFHDARGHEDHLPPGKGEIDFTAVRPYLKEDTLCVLELYPGTPDEEVSEGLAFLHGKGIA